MIGRRHITRRFTVVELLVVLLVSSVMAVLAEALLFFFYRGWDNSNRSVGIQRDGAYAATFIANVLREAPRLNVSVAADVITITGGDGTPTQEIRAVGSDLIYDPDTATNSDEVAIVSGRVISFAATNQIRHISYELALEDGLASTMISGAITQRNTLE